MIRILDKNVADKIAAGEVVDRPLSAVKELIENSIDAGADTITVEIREGGKSYIRVTDNGCGIDSSEVLTAFERHATSKIVTDKDLDSVETLGFRGEALASIAAVSRTEMLTKTAGAGTGVRVRIEGGNVTENIAAGCPDGTTVIVSDLFYNTPARMKFMKSDATEATLIIDLVSRIALAYPERRIRLINNGSMLFSTPGKGDRYRTVATIYGPEVAENLVPVSSGGEHMSVEGFVSVPSYSRPSRKAQIFFVNGRYVDGTALRIGVADAYSDRLFAGRYPIVFLFLSCDPDKLDVNVHPNKREVRFNDEQAVISFVSDAVRDALATKDAVVPVREKNVFRFESSFKEPSRGSEPKMNYTYAEELGKPEDGSRLVSEERAVPQVDIKSILSTVRKEALENQGFAEDEPEESYEFGDPRGRFDFLSLDVIGVVFNTYIAASDSDSFYLIDQHAAHERVFFEELRNQYRSSDKDAQMLLLPFVMNVSYPDSAFSASMLDVLRGFGYEVSEFGPNAFRFTAVPAFMTLDEAKDFASYFFENVSEGRDIENEQRLERIMSDSCKAAVKGGDSLKPEEITALLKQLSACVNPYSCPHGRPTVIKMTKHEIERLFKRV